MYLYMYGNIDDEIMFKCQVNLSGEYFELNDMEGR